MYPSRTGRIVSVTVAVLALAGCASLNVSSYVERGVDVRQYRTFGWGPTEGLSTGDPRLDNNRFFDERVRTTVEAGLAGRGFEKADDAPDLLVHYHASVTQRIDAREIDREYGTCENDSCRPYVYEAGTLVVDLLDPRTKKLVWRGWAEGAIDGVIDDQAWMEQKVGEVVARILEQLPRRL
jgi:hypothetical protein